MDPIQLEEYVMATTKKKETTPKTDSSTKAKNAAGDSETPQESNPTSGANLEESKDTSVDTPNQKRTTDKEGFLAAIEDIAARTFLRVPADKLYFTTDKKGFVDRRNAEEHANRIKNGKIYSVTKK